MIIENEATRFLNELHSYITESINDKARVFHVNYALTRTLNQKLLDLAIELQKRACSADDFLPMKSGNNTPVAKADDSYILLYLKHQLVRLHMEVQEAYAQLQSTPFLAEEEVCHKYFNEPVPNPSTIEPVLSDNEGRGLIFETEGDTLAQAFKSDYGNYSDGFRKAFHHETISYYRRTDREYVDIESPCLSAVLSGTPKQVAALIPNAENGLFIRFLFYYMNVKPTWKNVFAHQSGEGLDTHFENLGEEFYHLYKHLRDGPEIRFILSEEQQTHFNKFFSQVQAKYLSIKGIDYMATVRRLGLVAFRICMVLSALRIMETGECGETLLCDKQDFETALAIVSILVKHSSRVFSELPLDALPPGRKNRKERFLESLPGIFNRQKYLDVARKLSVPEKTAEGYITDFCRKNLIHREHHDNYLNPAAQEQK